MARQNFRVTPLRPGGEQAFSSELNRLLGQMSDLLARLEGLDGHTPQLGSDLNLNGNRLRNVGRATDAAHVVTVADARESGLYLTDQGEHVADRPIIAKAGLRVMDEPTDNAQGVVTFRRLNRRIGAGQVSDHNARVRVLLNGVLVGTRRTLNLHGSVTALDDPTNEEVDVTVTASGGGAGLLYEVPAGTVDGVNTTFTLTAAPAATALLLYKNGLLQVEGAGNDYTLSTNVVTFLAGNVPGTGDNLFAAYETAASLIYEVPAGVVDGVNDTFTVTAATSATHILLWKNGLFQTVGAGNDYTRSAATLVFEAGNLPGVGDALFAAYEP